MSEMSEKDVFASIDHPTQKFHYSPQGVTDTDKQNNSAQLAYVFLSMSHLTVINETRGGVIYEPCVFPLFRIIIYILKII